MKLLFSNKIRNFCTSYIRKMEQSIVGVCQMTSTNNKSKNLDSFLRLTQLARQKHVKFMFFPEGADYVAENSQESLQLSESLDGSLMNKYKAIAKENDIWLSIGGFHERIESSQTDEIKLYNSHVIIDNHGVIKQVYRKLHLFDVCIPEKNLNLKESAYVVKGPELIAPIETPIGKLGLSICYDLRFPEIATMLRKQGAQILTYPSAFTATTGEAHWEQLLRSRAIENQCYVIAAAQYGHHNSKRISYGHSLIIDPWGKIVAECEPYSNSKIEDESIAVANIDLSYLNKIQSEMPVFEHRRNDIYVLGNIGAAKLLDNYEYKFAHITIPPSTVFYRSMHSFAFTNIRCVVPGHVLVSSLRHAKRLSDLTSEEISDLFNTVVKIQQVMEKMHGSNSSTVCIQDGQNAGQTIAHVHVHILPRKLDDFVKNDDIYQELAKHDRDENSPVRTINEQEEEACALRKLF